MRRITEILVLTMAMIAPVHAEQILLNDTFEIPAGTATRTDDATDPNDTAWYQADGDGGSTSPVLSVATDLGDDALFMDITAGCQPFLGAFAKASLINIDDSITLTGEVRQPSLASGGFFIGLFYDSGTPTTVDNDTSSQDDEGYILALGTPTGTASGTSKLLKQVGGHEIIASGALLGTMVGTGIKPDNLYHDFSLSITQTGLSELTIEATWSGSSNTVTSIVSTDSADLVTSFNEVGMGFADQPGTGSFAQDYFVDNLKVSFVPEPGTLTLAALGLLGLVRRRKRKQ